MKMTRFTEARFLRSKYRSALGHGEDSVTDINIDLDRLGLKVRMSLGNNPILFLLKINRLHVFEIDLLN